jgi:adhesin/invasin
MNFSVSARTLSGGPWLTATAASGAAVSGVSSPIVTVTASQTGLAPGFYYGQVRVDAPGAANSPHVVTVAMQVLQPGQDPGPGIVPSEIVFNAVQGAPSPGSQELFVYNVSATPQTYVSSVLSNAGNQILFSPEGATLSLTQPTHVVVQPLTSSLPVGVYDSQLTLQFSDGFVRRAGIRTIVRPAPPAASSTSSETRRDAAGCTPSQLILGITSLGQSFAVPASFPASVEAQVQDDCGNTLDSGNVVASFSNGDPPLSLTSAQGGLWQTTWQAGQLSGPVTVTVTARDPVRNLAGTRQVTGGLGTSSMAPVLSAAVSAASFAPSAPLSPGSIISLFGQNLGNGTASAPSLPLGVTLADATVTIAGNSMPLIFGSSGQINAVVPSGINANTSHQILVQRDNQFSLPISVDVGPVNPAVFLYPLPGDPPNQGAVVNASYAVAQPGAPVTAGDVVVIFCTGLGPVNQAVPDGTASPSSPLAVTVATTAVTIGGQFAGVSFSGLAPGFVGLYQIDAVVPAGVTPGNQVPLIVSILNQTSPAVTIAVK